MTNTERQVHRSSLLPKKNETQIHHHALLPQTRLCVHIAVAVVLPLPALVPVGGDTPGYPRAPCYFGIKKTHPPLKYSLVMKHVKEHVTVNPSRVGWILNCHAPLPLRASGSSLTEACANRPYTHALHTALSELSMHKSVRTLLDTTGGSGMMSAYALLHNLVHHATVIERDPYRAQHVIQHNFDALQIDRERYTLHNTDSTTFQMQQYDVAVVDPCWDSDVERRGAFTVSNVPLRTFLQKLSHHSHTILLCAPGKDYMGVCACFDVSALDGFGWKRIAAQQNSLYIISSNNPR